MILSPACPSHCLDCDDQGPGTCKTCEEGYKTTSGNSGCEGIHILYIQWHSY